MFLKSLIKLIFLLFSTTLFALEHNPHQGGVAVIELKEFIKKPKVFFQSNEVKVLEKEGKYFAVIGIGIDEKVGKKHIVAVNQNKKVSLYFNVTKKSYKKEYIKLKTNKRVTLSKENLQRFKKEKAKSTKVLKSFNKTLSSNLEFISPLNGRISSTYGKRRYYNNKPKSPHKGIDIATKRGTSIVASESGVVKIAQEFFFNGNTIYLDHGEGVITMYAHMKGFEVGEGDFVEKGEVIGYVGTTGRSTGPHLHFGIMLNAKAVDPGIFVADYRNKSK